MLDEAKFRVWWTYFKTLKKSSNDKSSFIPEKQNGG